MRFRSLFGDYVVPFGAPSRKRSRSDHHLLKSVPHDHQALHRNLAYAQHPGEELLLDVYRPDTDTPVPAAIYFHGGGWRAGSKDHCAVRWLVRYGIAVVAVNYRLAPRHLFPSQLHDAKAAVRFVRAHAAEWGLAPEAVVAAGASSGAHLACLLGLTAGNRALEGGGDYVDQSSAVDAVVNYFAPTDFMTLQKGRSEQVASGPDAPEAQLLGHAILENPTRSRWASPLTYVHSDAPPFLHIHGEHDDLTPLEQTRNLHNALETAGTTSKMLLVRGAGHGGRRMFDHRPIRDRVASFIQRHTATDDALT